MNNPINFTGSTLNALGFQGCLASFLVDGRALDYQRALVSHGQMKLNVCSGKKVKLLKDFFSSFLRSADRKDLLNHDCKLNVVLLVRVGFVL